MSFDYAPYDMHAIVKASDVPLSLLHVAMIIHQLLKALAYCHQRSIVHCNVKPSSILLAAKYVLEFCCLMWAQGNPPPFPYIPSLPYFPTFYSIF